MDNSGKIFPSNLQIDITLLKDSIEVKSRGYKTPLIAW